MKTAIVDIQGFKLQNNEFVFKELAILTEEYQLQHYIFKPPFSYKDLTTTEKRQVKWLQHNFHGFKWDDGYIPYQKLYATVEPLLRNKIIFVKGSEKMRWIEQAFGSEFTTYDVEEDGCPKLSALKFENDVPSCIIHNGYCALENVFLIRNFMRNKT